MAEVVGTELGFEAVWREVEGAGHDSCVGWVSVCYCMRAERY